MKESLHKKIASRYSISEKNIVIMQMVADGFTSKEISAKTSLSDRTVENRIQKLSNDFDCRNKTHLVITLLREGIIN